MRCASGTSTLSASCARATIEGIDESPKQCKHLCVKWEDMVTYQGAGGSFKQCILLILWRKQQQQQPAQVTHRLGQQQWAEHKAELFTKSTLAAASSDLSVKYT